MLEPTAAGTRIRDARVRAGLEVAQLCADELVASTGLTPDTLAAIEDGRAAANAVQLIAIADATYTSFAQLTCAEADLPRFGPYPPGPGGPQLRATLERYAELDRHLDAYLTPGR